MAKVKFELNYRGVGELLKSNEMQSVLDSYATRIQKPGFTKEVKLMGSRAVAYVRAAKRDNSLLRALKS